MTLGKLPSSNLPWVEKYRPAKLDDLVSHEEIIKTINKFIDADQLPHLLFYGPPGTGKTSTILACAKRLYTPAQLNSMVLELNASDDRGIGIVRGQILSFASTRTIFKGGFKLIILDEADAMTNDAQNALRRIVEKYTENVRFCIICNYLSKIIPALQSRCTRFRFAPLDKNQIVPRLNQIAELEKVNMTDDGREALLTLSGGDMRKVLNILQSTSMAFDVVNEENVYTCVGHPIPNDISHIVRWLLNEKHFKETYNNIQEIKSAKGLALNDILTEIHRFIKRVELPNQVLGEILIDLSEIEMRLEMGASENVQLSALISTFMVARNKVIPDNE
ncbi:replication factor C subunit 5-like [Ctenocephalides felis]|uniref:replication factor C subunit 5-like n=1 Tax=Ctenocephalides felis TaxID=7515 RepID=UPI000E6E4576|nr:replication factor C subunit 5-like [Ctenocephalides felis]XP_026482699.1 replication factor C subunit 5-like [Ctenocephalides felis]